MVVTILVLEGSGYRAAAMLKFQEEGNLTARITNFCKDKDPGYGIEILPLCGELKALEYGDVIVTEDNTALLSTCNGWLPIADWTRYRTGMFADLDSDPNGYKELKEICSGK